LLRWLSNPQISRTQVMKMRRVLGLHGLAYVLFGVMILA
jgi:hypothetical protein